jgi:hypothetical protein
MDFVADDFSKSVRVDLAVSKAKPVPPPTAQLPALAGMPFLMLPQP